MRVHAERNSSLVLGCHPRTMSSHTLLMVYMNKNNFGVHLSKTREDTVNITVSGSSRCTWKCISTHSVTHDGLPRTRNTNLCTLSSENMWYPQLLSVVIHLQSHFHFSSCSSLYCERIQGSSRLVRTYNLQKIV